MHKEFRVNSQELNSSLMQVLEVGRNIGPMDVAHSLKHAMVDRLLHFL